MQCKCHSNQCTCEAMRGSQGHSGKTSAKVPMRLNPTPDGMPGAAYNHCHPAVVRYSAVGSLLC